jgi:hypothetical protein
MAPEDREATVDLHMLRERSQTVRDEWEAVIDGLGPHGLEHPGAAGEWSVRDVIAHANCWDRWQLVQLRSAFSGESSTDAQLHGDLVFPPNDDMHPDAMNAMFMAAYRDRSTGDVLAHFREVADMRGAWLDRATQEQLDAQIGLDWPGYPRVMRLVSEVPEAATPGPAWSVIADQVAHHEGHLAEIRAWMTAS